MPRHIYLGVVMLCAGGVLLSGCGTVPVSRKNSALNQPEDADKVDRSPAAAERRAEAHARYAAAILHDWDEEPELAAAEYLKAALADPENETLVLEVSQRLLQLKQNDQALKLLVKATAQPNASGALYARLGLLYSLLGKKELAIEANRTAVKKMPQSIAGYRHLAQIYFQAGQYDEGLKILDQAAKQSVDDAGFLIELSELYTSFIRPGNADSIKKRALALLERAARLKPEHPLLIQKMADGFSMAGRPEKAAQLYSQLLERFPTLPGLREKLADLYLRTQDHRRAAEQLHEIIRNNPTQPQPYYALGAIAYDESKDSEKGKEYVEKKLTEAIDYFSKTLMLNASLEPVYYDMAGALISLNKPQDALRTLEKAHDKFPQSFVGEFFTALAYSRMKEYTNAIKHFEGAEIIARATDTNRLTHLFYYQLGSTYERIQQYDVAENYFKKCLSLSPDFSEALNYLGYMWAERGVNLPQARQMIEKAVKQEPKNAAFLDSLGWVLFKLEKPKEALPWLLKALDNSEEPDATLYDHLGDIYFALKQPDKARDAWQKSIKLEPNEVIQKKLGPTPTSGVASPSK